MMSHVYCAKRGVCLVTILVPHWKMCSKLYLYFPNVTIQPALVTHNELQGHPELRHIKTFFLYYTEARFIAQWYALVDQLLHNDSNLFLLF